MDPVPVISAKQVSDAVSVNSFAFDYFNEPSDRERLAMASSLGAGIDPLTFHQGYRTRQNRHFSAAEKYKDKPSRWSDGSAVWIVGSFMNHTSHCPTGAREFFGKMMFVHAAVPLRAGDEVTIQYSSDKEVLKKWGIN